MASSLHFSFAAQALIDPKRLMIFALTGHQFLWLDVLTEFGISKTCGDRQYKKCGRTTNFVSDENQAPDAKSFILQALRDTGMSLEELAERLDYKSLKRAMYGEITLPESKRRHIQDLVLLSKAYSPKHGGARVEEIPPVSYGSNPRSILKKRREEMGLSVDSLARLAKVPANFISKIENGEVQGSNVKLIRKLAAALKLDPDALLGGSDHPPTISDHTPAFGSTPDVRTTDNIVAKTIPLISMAQAGNLTQANFEDVYDYEGVIAYAGKDPRAFAVRIRGESMMPEYGPGTIAIVYPSQRARNDNLVIAKIGDGSVLFKRVQITDGEIIFHSINPNYPPMKYSERDIAWIYPVGLTQKVEL